jgi:hypothetical protein
MKKAWVLICVAALSLCAPGADARDVKVLRDARIRDKPDMNSGISNYVREGDIVPLVEQKGSWYKVICNGEEGWVFSELVSILPDESGQTAADLFTKQDMDIPPPDPGITEEEMKYARARKSNVSIRSHRHPKDPDTRVLRTTRGRDEWFPLLHEGTALSLVAVTTKDAEGKDKDTVGWVMNDDIEVLDAKPTEKAVVADAKKIGIGLIIIIGIALIITVIITILHIRSSRKRNVYVQKNVLILAKEGKQVQYTLTNTMAPIEKCFTELGFNVALVKDSVVARNNIEQKIPDLMLIDWNFEPAIFAKIENLFSRLSGATSAYILFFNVPDVSSAPASKVLRKVSFLGINVVDRDIFKIVTPLLVHAESAQNIQKSRQHCALEGEIAGGNLLEVLQFIEIGSKTGCLMVETKGPFGLVYFGDGRIIYAAAAKGQGVEAVYAILNLTAGKFRFITNKQPKVANLNLPTLSVLMEWTKEKDEAKR